MSNENLNEKIFYYRFNKLNAWLILNLALTITLVYWGVRCPCLLFWVQTQVLLGVCLLSWLVWGWKYVLKHKAVVVDDEGIKLTIAKSCRGKILPGRKKRMSAAVFATAAF